MAGLFRLVALSKERLAQNGSGFRLRVPLVSVQRGEMVALVGESGCGKSTLLDMLALALRPDTWESFTFQPGDEEVDVGALWQGGDHDRLGDLRRRHMGYVLQTGGLLPFLSVRENMVLPRRLVGLDDDIGALAQSLGIGALLDKLPGLLSVGERQRAAIGRALAHEPSVVIADEPTASLDPINAERIMAIFLDLVKERGHTLILASHDWARVEALGLRPLKPKIERGEVVESIFAG